MSFLDSLPPLGDIEVRCTTALPFEAHNQDGEPLVTCHWFPMYDYIYVSPQLWDKLKSDATAQSETVSNVGTEQPDK